MKRWHRMETRVRYRAPEAPSGVNISPALAGSAGLGAEVMVSVGSPSLLWMSIALDVKNVGC